MIKLNIEGNVNKSVIINTDALKFNIKNKFILSSIVGVLMKEGINCEEIY